MDWQQAPPQCTGETVFIKRRDYRYMHLCRSQTLTWRLGGGGGFMTSKKSVKIPCFQYFHIGKRKETKHLIIRPLSALSGKVRLKFGRRFVLLLIFFYIFIRAFLSFAAEKPASWEHCWYPLPRIGAVWDPLHLQSPLFSSYPTFCFWTNELKARYEKCQSEIRRGTGKNKAIHACTISCSDF